MKKDKMLVIGASGLLGKRFVDLYFDKYEIFTLGRSNMKNCKNIFVDLQNSIDINMLPSDINILVYLAQSNQYKDFPNSSLEIININSYRVLELLQYAKKIKIKTFLYASTGSVYTSDDAIKYEDEFIDINKLDSFYARSKITAELMVQAYREYFNTVIIRPFFMFGERQNKNMFIPRIIENIRNGNKIYLNGKEGIKINPIYVEDAANILNFIIKEQKTGIYNIAGSEIISLKELCLLIGKKLEKKPVFEYIDESSNFIADISKIDYKKYTTLNDAIGKVINV